MTTPRLTAFIITALVLSGGCSQQDATASQPGDQPANVAMKTPPIYLRQTAVTMKYGHPYVETQYKQQLSRCQKLQGRISVSPIPSELADKLGRTYYQIWLKGERAAVQSKSWGFTEGDGLKMCHFHAVSHTRKSIDNVHDTYRINLDKGTATRQSSSPVVRHAIKPQPPAQKAADARQRSEVVAELKKRAMRARSIPRRPSRPLRKWRASPAHKRAARLMASPAYGPAVFDGVSDKAAQPL